MGLDITAYRQIKKLDCVYDQDGEPIDPQSREGLDYDFTAYVNPDFPGRADDVENKGVYTAQERMGFRAGSYGGYNFWRDELAKLAGYPAVGVDRYNTGNVQHRHDESAWAVRFVAQEGGSVDIGFKITAHPKDEIDHGKVATRLQQEMIITLSPPDKVPDLFDDVDEQDDERDPFEGSDLAQDESRIDA